MQGPLCEPSQSGFQLLFHVTGCFAVLMYALVSSLPEHICKSANAEAFYQPPLPSKLFKLLIQSLASPEGH